MNSGALTLIACTPLVGGWIAVTLCHYRLAARRRRERAAWARLAERVSGLPELDADLDRAWGDEQEWIRRYR
jgi:hypothetical protein